MEELVDVVAVVILVLPLFLITCGAAQHLGKNTQLCFRCVVPGTTQNCQKEVILELLW